MIILKDTSTMKMTLKVADKQENHRELMKA